MLDIKNYEGLRPVISYFEEIAKIPRGSGNTSAIADYLVEFARSHSLEYYRDGADNVIIKKPATVGLEDRDTIIIQGHTDMVCDKVSGLSKDMEKEGVDLYIDGDYLRARGTTLGGDDGVFVAYALALLSSTDIPHPAIEALFTSDEEIGLIGAGALDVSHLSGRMLINIDSDVEGIFTVGCAGGMRTDTAIDMPFVNSHGVGVKITLSGFIGGHSGMEIDKGRANAIKALASLVLEIGEVEVASFIGGNADNAIPRSAECVIYTKKNAEDIEKALSERARALYSASEGDLTLSAEDVGETHTLSPSDSARLLSYIDRLPSGVIKMSEEIEGLPETSANLGVIKTRNGGFDVCVSIRSSKDIEKNRVKEKIENLARGEGFSFSYRGEYPAWEYRPNSRLCDTMCKTYREFYGKDAEVVIIHAGLECGIFTGKIPDIDCVSIGPDNLDIHTPQERLSLSSTLRVWEYLKKLLIEL